LGYVGLKAEGRRRYSRHATGDSMERVMSLGAVPDADEMSIGGIWMPGRQLRTWSGIPVAWVTDKAFSAAGLIWTDLGRSPPSRG
jgi:hypothetical protein